MSCLGPVARAVRHGERTEHHAAASDVAGDHRDRWLHRRSGQLRSATRDTWEQADEHGITRDPVLLGSGAASCPWTAHARPASVIWMGDRGGLS